MKDKIAIAGLFIGLGLLAWYIFKNSKKALSNVSKDVSSAISVKDKIADGFSESMQTLTDGEIDNYGRNLDLLDSEANVIKSLGIKDVSGAMISGAQTLLSLTDNNLKAVIKAWEKKNNKKFSNSALFASTLDETGTVPSLYDKVRTLNI